MKVIISISSIISIAFVAFISGCKAEDEVGAREVCLGLEKAFRKQRYMTAERRQEYCDWGCKFAGQIDCKKVEPTRLGFNVTGFLSNLTDVFFEWGSVENLHSMEFTSIPEEPVMDLATYMLPFALAIIPAIFNRLFFRDSPGSVFVCVLIYMTIFWVIFWDRWLEIAFNLTYSVIACFVPFGNNVFNEMIVGWLLNILVLVVSLTCDNAWFKLAVGVSVAAINASTFYLGINSKNPNARMGVLVSILQSVASIVAFTYVTTILGVESTAISVIQYTISAALPFGPVNEGLSNFAYASRNLAVMLPISAGARVILTAVLFFLAAFIFIITRACIGGVVLVSLQFRFTPYYILHGFYSYCIDFTGPIHVLVECISNRGDRLRGRKLLYAITMIILGLSEFFYFLNFLMLRVMLYALDYLFINSGYGDATKYLDVDIDCSAIAFPKLGALPAFSLDKVLDIAKAVHEIVSVNKTLGGVVIETKKGACLVRSDPRGGKQVVTARHCVGDEAYVAHQLISGIRGEHGKSSDPVTSLRADGLDVHACNICFAVAKELELLKYLVIIHKDKVCTYISNFRVRGGDLEVIANVMQGDSGSPVLGVLNDGQVRLVGVVSRGTFDGGTGNLISMVTDPNGDFSGSPGASVPVLDMQPANPTDERVLGNLRSLLYQNNESLRSTVFTDQFEQYKDTPWEDIPDDVKPRVKERIKSWKKNRAFKKRAGLFAASLGYLDDKFDKEAILCAFEQGRIVEFNRLRRALPMRGFVPAGGG